MHTELEVRKWLGKMWDFAICVVNGDTLLGINDKAKAERIAALWNAFNGISTHDAPNIIQVVKSLQDEPDAVKYLEHGAEMERRIEHHCAMCALDLGGKDEQCRTCHTTVLLAKLEGGE